MRIGIDLGGTKIEGITLENSGEISHRLRIPTPQGDYQAIINSILELVNELENLQGNKANIGIGIPGSISPKSGKIRNANSTCLIGNDLQTDLQNKLQRPIRLANDADCFTLSEASDGAGKDENNVFGVILGTGTGGGIVINKTLLSGPNRIAGEWGHNPLPWPKPDELPGPNCFCGKQGCIETFLSGPGLNHSYKTAGGDNIDAAIIMERVDQGEELAIDVFSKYKNQLARGLSSIINVLDPDVIILGGGLSKINSLYDAIPKIWEQYVFSDIVKTKLKAPQHGDSSGVRGAAWLWPAPSD